jgi:tRNA A-37 threonylcarbamoyl transferase component Bud32
VPESFAEGLVGIVLDGRYRLDAVLGEGGMGAVYRAHHLAMDRKVAVKLLKPHLSQDHSALERFAREARSTLKVDSEHAVKVLDFGVTPHDDYYMVLEYLDGRTVQRELDVDGAFEPARVLRIATHALRALGAAHRIGLVHRDIKPENLLLMKLGDDPDYTKVLDFGVAKLMEGAAKSSRSALSLTQAGMVFGTPEFMSPEQACGRPLDPRSDLYSLAATMFAMLTGCGMYPAGTAIEWLTAHARQPAPHLVDGKPELAPFTGLDALLQRCLAKQPAQRPQDADALIAEIEALEALGVGASVDASHACTPAPPRVPAAPTGSLPTRVEPRLATTASPSSFVHALALAEPDALPVTRPRGRRVVVGALAVLGLAVVATVRTMHHAPAQRATTAGPIAAASVVAVPASPRVIDAGTIDAAPAVRQPVVLRAKPGPGMAEPNPAVAQHIAAALVAQREGNHLTQVTQAHAAVLLDPRNVRAVLLLADGLLAEGDLEHGCKYLRGLVHNPAAIERLRSASCPAD